MKQKKGCAPTTLTEKTQAVAWANCMSEQRATATILIVDDDRGLLRLIERALRRENFKTACAVSGREALAWLSQNGADLMLLDLKLEDVEGKDLIHQLTDMGRSVPFIVITGQGDERVAVEMMKRGALDYLVKDVDFLQFVPAVVGRALGQIERDKRLVELEKALLEISEREQRRIGQDLHDGLGQHLAGIELMSQVLEQNLASKKLKAEAGRAGEIARHVREAISQARLLARGLSPVVLESAGLMSALQELAASTEQMFRVTTTFHCAHAVLMHNHTVATHLYRIAQEAVSNAIKHGKASRVEIGFEKQNNIVTLRITDNGAGIPEVLPATRGMGMSIMQYRAGVIGGVLRFERRAEGGTTVTCSVRDAAPAVAGA